MIVHHKHTENILIKQFCFFLIALNIFISSVAHAIVVQAASSFLPDQLADIVIQSIGLAMDHRAYEPATAMAGLTHTSLGVEATLVQPPAAFGRVLNQLSGQDPNATSPVAVIPSIKLHLHQSLGKTVDFGFSILPISSVISPLKGTLLIGGDLKWTFFQPEEGPSWAFRFSYNYNSLNYSGANLAALKGYDAFSIHVKTVTLTPQIVISKKIDYADPYIGAGFQYAYGTVMSSLSFNPIAGVEIPSIEVVQDASAKNAYFFGGVSLRVPNFIFGMTIEGAYSPSGMNSIGTKISFLF
jgi:hypothetical protein